MSRELTTQSEETMKFKGQKVQPPKPEMIVLPRGENNEDALVFYAGAILNFDEFDRICPQPLPTKKVYPGGKVVDDFESEEYKTRINAHLEKRFHWLVLTSLKSTPDLEWETVDHLNPDTWANYEKELAESMTKAEITSVQMGVMNANSMNEERQRQARSFFQRTPAQQ